MKIAEWISARLRNAVKVTIPCGHLSTVKRPTVDLSGVEIFCLDCGKVQMVMVAPSGRVLVEWVKP